MLSTIVSHTSLRSQFRVLKQCPEEKQYRYTTPFALATSSCISWLLCGSQSSFLWCGPTELRFSVPAAHRAEPPSDPRKSRKTPSRNGLPRCPLSATALSAPYISSVGRPRRRNSATISCFLVIGIEPWHSSLNPYPWNLIGVR